MAPRLERIEDMLVAKIEYRHLENEAKFSSNAQLERIERMVQQLVAEYFSPL